MLDVSPPSLDIPRPAIIMPAPFDPAPHRDPAMAAVDAALRRQALMPGAPRASAKPRKPFATIVSSTGNGGTSSTASANLPAGISGDRLLFFASVVSGSTRTISAPAGFSETYNVIPANGVSTHRRAALFQRTADGSEGATISASLSGSSEWGVVIVRLRGWGLVSVSSAAVSSTPVGANPPSHTAPWGLLNTLWLAVAHAYNAPGTAPSNYTIVNSGANGNAAMAVASRARAVATEDPGAFGTACDWHAVTIAIRSV